MLFTEEYVEGQMAGETHHVVAGRLTTDDLYAVADIIKVTQQQGAKFVDVPDSPFMLTGENRADMYAKYWKNIVSRKPGFDAALGDEAEVYYQKLTQVLEGAKALGESTPYYFTHGDIHPAHILKTSEGKLALLDWERVCASNNPGHDYAWILAT